MENMEKEIGHIRQGLNSITSGALASLLKQQIRYSPEVDSQNWVLVFLRSDPPGSTFVLDPLWKRLR